MNLGLILYIEDSEAQRKALKMALEHRGFGVEVAGDVATARSLFEKLRGQIDVVVLDMRLEDPLHSHMTGADVTIEYYGPQTPHRPEILIHTAYPEVDYYKLALKLGVATFLDKSEYEQVDLIRHVRALAIRRFLSIKHPEASDRIKRLVEASRNRSEAIVRFCRDELEPVFFDRLGTPFVFLLTENNHTYCYTREEGLPERLGLYETIQAMVCSEGRPGTPFIIDVDKTPALSAPEEKKVLNRLNGAAFIPLTNDEDTRLSVGVLSSDPDLFPLGEPPFEMASVLAKHLRSAVIKPFLTVLTKWTEHDTRRKELMRITGEVYVPFGRSQLSFLQRLESSFPQLVTNNDFRRLRNMAESLQVTGSILESLAKVDDRKGAGVLAATRVPLNQIVESVWANLDNRVSPDTLSVHGDCDINVTSEDLSIMVSSILQWFAQRFIDTPPGIEPHISVHCHRDETGAEMIFEDRSARLDKVLRECLFHPVPETTMTSADDGGFKGSVESYSSLFLVKTLVEAKYNGVLADVSDAITDTIDETGEGRGHRFRIRLPAPHPGLHQ